MELEKAMPGCTTYGQTLALVLSVALAERGCSGSTPLEFPPSI
jgi:hypothetical protein